MIDATPKGGKAVGHRVGRSPALADLERRTGFHGAFGRTLVDYLFLAPGLPCAAARVLETTTSDHRPVLVTLTGAP